MKRVHAKVAEETIETAKSSRAYSLSDGYVLDAQ